jgi:hypothetical protein
VSAAGTTAGSPPKRLLRWLLHRSLLAWYLVLSLLLGAAGAVLLFEQRPEVWVASADLPAFHSITRQDLKVQKFSSGNLRGRAIPTTRMIGEIVGRYTLGEVEAGIPLQDDQLGPQLHPPMEVEHAVVVGLSLSPARVLGGRLDRGDRVNLILPDDELRPEQRKSCRPQGRGSARRQHYRRYGWAGVRRSRIPESGRRRCPWPPQRPRRVACPSLYI